MNIKDKNVLFTIEWGGSACRLGPGDVVLARRELGYRPAQRDQLRQRLAHPLAALAQALLQIVGGDKLIIPFC
ncbi:hypothetical protein ExPECSC030_00092 [Escherichia coli]|nr:hypothetical protein ExPECSC030_00092 [Escherichia coli]